MTTPTITAINPKNQAAVSRLYLADRLYHTYVDLGDAMESVSNGSDAAERELAKNCNLQEKAYNKANELYYKLTRAERRNAERQYKELHGYNLV